MMQKLVSGWMSALSNCTVDSAAVKLGNVHGTNQGNYGHSIRCSCHLLFSKYPVKVHCGASHREEKEGATERDQDEGMTPRNTE